MSQKPCCAASSRIERKKLLNFEDFFNFCFFCFIPFIILALLSPSLPVAAQIRGHIAGPTPPSPPRYVPSFFSPDEFSILFPRRLASNRTYPRCQTRSAISLVIPFFDCIFGNKVKSHRGGNRTRYSIFNPRRSVRGQPLDHRSDRHIIQLADSW